MNPAISHPADLLVLSKIHEDVIDLAKQIRLAVFDVDGTLTDGGLYYNEHGEALKKFSVLDGYGLSQLQNHGIQVAIITGRRSPIAARRAAELGIAQFHEHVKNKKPVVQEIAASLNIELSQTAFMGDDIIDLSAMQSCGFAVSVPNAPSYVQQAAHWVTHAAGGDGAVREFCDLIMAAQGMLGAHIARSISMPGQPSEF